MANFITCDREELIFALDHTPTSRNILLLGPHGVGKSQIVTSYYEKKGSTVVPLFLGQMSDPGDITGLPYKRKVVLADGTETERMDFLPPYWWDDTKPFCLFLDEINRARPEILNVVMDLTLNKTIAGRKLPEGSVIVAAGNIGDGYTISDLDKALLDRFVPFVFKPTPEEWCDWAGSSGYDSRVVEFILQNPKFLDEAEDAEEMEVTPSRRSWVGVCEALATMNEVGPRELKYLAGYVGPAAIGKFGEFLRTKVNIDVKELLEKGIAKYKDVLKKMDTQEIVSVNEKIAFSLKTTDATDEIAKNFYDYMVELKELKQDEALGHIMLYFKKDKDVKKFLKNPKSPIFKFVVDFISQTGLE